MEREDGKVGLLWKELGAPLSLGLEHHRVHHCGFVGCVDHVLQQLLKKHALTPNSARNRRCGLTAEEEAGGGDSTTVMSGSGGQSSAVLRMS